MCSQTSLEKNNGKNIFESFDTETLKMRILDSLGHLETTEKAEQNTKKRSLILRSLYRCTAFLTQQFIVLCKKFARMQFPYNVQNGFYLIKYEGWKVITIHTSSWSCPQVLPETVRCCPQFFFISDDILWCCHSSIFHRCHSFLKMKRTNIYGK